jgi:hypothetical protein
MSIVILSYRLEYGEYFRGDCEYRSDADFDMIAVETTDAAADYIARRIHEEPKSDYANLVFERWEDIVAFAHDFSPDKDTGRREESIFVPTGYGADDDYDGDGDDREAHDGRRNRRKQLRDELVRLVAEKLGVLSAKAIEEKKRREAEAWQRAEDARIARQEADERATFARLKAKYEPGT